MSRSANLAYKILTEEQWAAFSRAGSFAGAPIDAADGYIHLSAADTVVETAAKHFTGQQGLMLVAVDLDALGAGVRWEVSRGGALFPHLYGALPMTAVVRSDPLPLDGDGRHRFPDPEG